VEVGRQSLTNSDDFILSGVQSLLFYTSSIAMKPNKTIPKEHNDPAEPKDVSGAIISITNHAHAEIASVRRQYYFVGSIVALLVGVGLFFTFHSASEWKNEIRQDVKDEQAKMSADIASQEKKQSDQLIAEAERVRVEVVKRVDAEFNEQNIAALVRDEAKKRIDLIADSIIQKNISNQVAPVRAEFLEVLTKSSQDMKSKIAEMDAALNKSAGSASNLQSIVDDAKKALSKLDQESDFLTTAVAAQNDDRAAYDKLVTLGSDSASPFKTRAYRISMAIRNDWSSPTAHLTHLKINWAKNVDPATMKLPEFIGAWKEMADNPEFGVDFMDTVWASTNLTRLEKMEFTHEIIGNSHNSSAALDRAAKKLRDELSADYPTAFMTADINEKWNQFAKTNKVSELLINAPVKK
jgi:hypothetical protein